MAPERGDHKTLGSSILIIARKHDRPMPFKAPPWIHRFDRPLPHRPIESYEYGYWWNEWGGEHDTIRDNERIRHELQRTALGIWDLIKNSGHYKDSENWALHWVGAIPGKRESRQRWLPFALPGSIYQANMASCTGCLVAGTITCPSSFPASKRLRKWITSTSDLAWRRLD